MEDGYDIAVIGGGVAGVSALAAMAGEARVALLETESQPGYHATGRSAAILAQSYGSRIVRALTAVAGPWYNDPPDGFAERPLLSPRGLVRIGTAPQMQSLTALYRDMADTVALTWLDAEAVEARVPLLRPGVVAAGFLNDAAADIDVHALLTGYLRTAREAGADVLTGAEVAAIERRDGGWRITTRDGREVAAGVIVDAAGAWADIVAEMAGVRPVGLVPMRRSAATIAAPGGIDLASMPLVVDADEEFYLKPEAGRLMASPADETPAMPADARPEEIDIAICLDRIAQVFDVGEPRPLSTWAGLRTFAPDREPVCGWDAEVPGFYWLAGQGGAGVQTAPTLARLAADEVLGREGAARLDVPGVARADLAAARFA